MTDGKLKILRYLKMKDETTDQRYVYIKSEPTLFTVGFYKPDGRWEPESDHDTREEAAARVHYLNGGN